MTAINYKFSKSNDQEFVKILISRVNNYFSENAIPRTANSSMILKTFVTFGFYIAVYLIILFGEIQNLTILFILWGLLGIGQALVGFCIMHDTLHKAHINNKFIYGLLQIPIIAIGVESDIWKIEHIFMHHNFTNIEGIDQDIHPRLFFRFSKHQPRKWFHRYQHIYAIIFYGLLIIEWVTIKDFIKVINYRKMGFIKSNKKAFILALKIFLKKSLFYIVFLIIPLHFIPFSSLIIFCMFLTMLFIAGLVMTIIFQTAHVVPNTEFIYHTEPTINENWHVHQLKTTCNYASNNKFITYFFGGLNYQVEHHLFPSICHVHYPEIAKIVRETTDEFGIPYNTYNSFTEAIKMHFFLLKKLGK